MKKKLIHKVNRSKIAVLFYYFQLIIFAPVLIPVAIVGGLAEFILNCWGAYKDWYLAKSRRN